MYQLLSVLVRNSESQVPVGPVCPHSFRSPFSFPPPDTCALAQQQEELEKLTGAVFSVLERLSADRVPHQNRDTEQLESVSMKLDDMRTSMAAIGERMTAQESLLVRLVESLARAHLVCL